ncbi:hypothetical protein B0J14DRAFT_257422 [Halenospora varia]|nr:hypothetical protein B0J14DRAFT_257422 [Halenospora varia]
MYHICVQTLAYPTPFHLFPSEYQIGVVRGVVVKQPLQTPINSSHALFLEVWAWLQPPLPSPCCLAHPPPKATHLHPIALFLHRAANAKPHGPWHGKSEASKHHHGGFSARWQRSGALKPSRVCLPCGVLSSLCSAPSHRYNDALHAAVDASIFANRIYLFLSQFSTSNTLAAYDFTSALALFQKRSLASRLEISQFVPMQ